jgi:hypothetical protein
MQGHSRLLTRVLVLPVGVLIAGRGIILHYISSYTALWAAAVSGVFWW